MKPGTPVETKQGPGVVIQLDWQKFYEHGRPRDHAFVIVELADGRRRIYPAADVHPSEAA